MAWAFRRYGNAYDDIEDRTRPTGIGIWQADTEAPWDYRAKRWNVGEQEAPDGCPIKGNINRQGERIYHAPWSPWYSRTKVSVEQGEKWFCDEGGPRSRLAPPVLGWLGITKSWSGVTAGFFA